MHPQIRPVHDLVHVNIGRAGNFRDALFDLVCDIVAFRVAARDLNVDRRRNAEIQNLTHDVRRGEKELHVRKTRCNFSRRMCTYWAVGLCLAVSATRISPSASPMVALSLKARLIPLAGRPMLSSTVSISLGGITSRIARPT